jgi:ankyrin repeat protein
LYLASIWGHARIAKYLIEQGANVHWKTLEYPNSTILSSAAEHDHSEVVKLLIVNGARVDTISKNGTTALHKSASNGNSSIVTLLLENGAELNIRDKEGQSALMLACLGGHLQIVKLLEAVS